MVNIIKKALFTYMYYYNSFRKYTINNEIIEAFLDIILK